MWNILKDIGSYIKVRVGNWYTTLQMNSVYLDFSLIILVQKMIHFPSYFNIIMITATKQCIKIICIL